MKQAVQDYGPQSPFVHGLLDTFSNANTLIPLDWEDIGKTAIEGPAWLQLRSWWAEEARTQVRLNAQRQPPGPTEDELKGSGQYATLATQAALTDPRLIQVKLIFLKACRKIETSGQSVPSFVKTLEGPTEPYTDFLSHLKEAVLRGLGTSEAASIIIQSLAFENANPDCQKVLRPFKGRWLYIR